MKTLPEFRKNIVLKSSQAPPVCPSASSSLSVEQLCCAPGPGKLKYLGRGGECPFPTHLSVCLEWRSGVRGERLATGRLSRGMAICRESERG